METITKQQIIIINTLLTNIGKLRGEAIGKEEKAGLIMGLSNNRTNTTTELTKNEAAQFIGDLQGAVANPKEKSAEVMRKHIIAMAHEMGWELPGGKIDMIRINNWAAQFGYLNKTHHSINQYSYNELPALVTQFKKVYQSYLKGI